MRATNVAIFGNDISFHHVVRGFSSNLETITKDRHVYSTLASDADQTSGTLKVAPWFELTAAAFGSLSHELYLGTRHNPGFVMPIYEYTCQSCNSRVELLIRGDEIPSCPDCRGTDLVKEFSVPAAHSGNSLPVVPPGGG